MTFKNDTIDNNIKSTTEKLSQLEMPKMWQLKVIGHPKWHPRTEKEHQVKN